MKNIVSELEIIRQQNLYRQIRTCTAVDAVHAELEGKQYLLLSANNYLGLTHNAKVQEQAAQAVYDFGTGAGGARLTTGSTPLHDALETALAVFKETEACLLFNTGYMANVGTIAALAGKNDVIFSDELNHASIIDGCRLSRGKTVVYRHCSRAHLAECLQKTPCQGRRLIVTDGVFSMDGDIAPLPDILDLAKRYDALVMVDDAHALGVIGRGGRGTVSYFGLEGQVDIQMGTMSKSLAAEGGYVTGKKELIQYLINRARSFIFSTALSPAVVAAANGALAELVANPELVQTLQSHALLMRQMLGKAGFAISEGVTPIIPVIVGDAQAALSMSQSLKEAGLLISAIRPPTVASGASRLRITVSAAHSREELEQAAQKIINIGRKLQILR